MSVEVLVYPDCKLYSENMTPEEFEDEFHEDERDYVMRVYGEGKCSGKFKDGTVWEHGGDDGTNMGSGHSFAEFIEVLNKLAVKSGYHENGEPTLFQEVNECDQFDSAACKKIYSDLNKIHGDVYYEMVKSFKPDSILEEFFEERFDGFKSAFECGADNGYVEFC